MAKGQNEDTFFDQALNYLSFKARTVKEMEEYLGKKGADSKEIENIVNRLSDYGYLNDDSYVEEYCYQNAFGKRFSRKKLLLELKRRGIDENRLEKASSLLTDEDEKAYLVYHYEKILKKSEGEPFRKRLKTIHAYLSRRLFEAEMIAQLLSTLREEDCSIDEIQFIRHLQRASRRLRRKGIEGREMKAKLIQSLLQRGYPYDYTKDHIEAYLEAQNKELDQ